MRVQPAVLYVDDGDLLTSGGVGRRSRPLPAPGAPRSRQPGGRDGRPVERRAAASRRRAGAVRPRPRCRTRHRRPSAPGWTGRANASTDPSRSRSGLAAVGASPRTFARRFRDVTGRDARAVAGRGAGTSCPGPARGTDLPVETVAERCGFATAAGLRKHFTRRVGTTPQHDPRPGRGTTTAPRAEAPRHLVCPARRSSATLTAGGRIRRWTYVLSGDA